MNANATVAKKDKKICCIQIRHFKAVSFESASYELKIQGK